ncbi:MAG: hypothetical protein SangKO_041760 [Sandaracinaceae bacterium]
MSSALSTTSAERRRPPPDPAPRVGWLDALDVAAPEKLAAELEAAQRHDNAQEQTARAWIRWYGGDVAALHGRADETLAGSGPRASPASQRPGPDGGVAHTRPRRRSGR